MFKNLDQTDVVSKTEFSYFLWKKCYFQKTIVIVVIKKNWNELITDWDLIEQKLIILDTIKRTWTTNEYIPNDRQ